MSASPPTADDDILVLTRTFNAPRALVWSAWTSAEHLAEWWGPAGFTLGVINLDLRSGGVFHYSMRSPAGDDMWGRFDYLAVEAPARLSFINGFSDRDGNITRHPLSPTWPLRAMNELILAEHDDRTSVTLRAWPHEATAEEIATFAGGKQYVQQAFKGTFDQLEAHLARARGDANG